MIKTVVVFFFVFCGYSFVMAQKRTIDENAYINWPYINEAAISNDGKFVVYSYGRNGKDTLTVQSTGGNYRNTIVRGHDAVFSEDSRMVIYKIQGDSLGILDLYKETSQFLSNVDGFKTPKEGDGQWLAYQLKDGSKRLIVRDLYSGAETQVSFVKNYFFNENGSVIVIEKSDTLLWFDLLKNKKRVVLCGAIVGNISFDKTGSQIVFTTSGRERNEHALYYYRSGMDSARIECPLGDLPSGMIIANAPVRFSSDGQRIFFKLKKNLVNNDLIEKNIVNVNVWSYKDSYLQTEVNEKIAELKNKMYNVVKTIGVPQIIQLDKDSVTYWSKSSSMNENFVLGTKNYGVKEPWMPLSRGLYLISTNTEDIRTIVEGNNISVSQFTLSPHGNYVVWFDDSCKQYNSYEIDKGSIHKGITRDVKVALNYENLNSIIGGYGIAGWMANDEYVLIYDEYDIWQIDLRGKKKAVCITGGYGRTHHISFRVWNRERFFSPRQVLLLCALDNNSKDNGFYKIQLGDEKSLYQCSIGPYFYHMPSIFLGWFLENNKRPLKAKNTEGYVVSRESAREYPNLFFTKDFKSFKQLTNLNPHQEYNWLTAELIHWPMSKGGRMGEGILYKPENFDSTQKYPIIFNYYDVRRSYELNMFKRPEFASHNINIPYYVSNGYLVFIPNLYYTVGKNTEGITHSVVSAAEYLSEFPWVDSTKMGLQGHSFGGYATSCIISNSNIFKAACEAAGIVDLVSCYGGLYENSSAQPFYEAGQGNMGGTLWDYSDLYIENSPFFNLPRVTTPLLMMHNKNDTQSPFGEAIKLFTGLRRLSKKVWLLEYERDGHSVSGKNAEDFTIRMQQFFDYYLKGKSAPKWMIEGIPVHKRGYETGYEPDVSGLAP